MDDHMDIGGFVPLKGGWFLDSNTNTKFTFDEDGNPIDEDGQLLIVEFNGDDDVCNR